MKKLFVGLMVIGAGAFTNSLQAQDVIWGGPDEPNSTFAGGLNDWTAVGIRCSNKPDGTPVDGSEALWIWSANGSSKGAYSTRAIMSPSAANGAMVFDSDYLDNNGVQGAFGAGTCPSFHRGELISPVIDLTGEVGVGIQFYQLYRQYAGPDGTVRTNATFLEVTPDGGATWISIPLNPTAVFNEFTANPSIGYVNVSQWANNNPEFQFKFVFDGDYYVWIVDDVSLITVPEVNLMAGQYQYTGQNKVQPRDVSDRDEYLFALEVINEGQEIDARVTVEVIRNADQSVLFDATGVINIPGGATRGIDFAQLDQIWSPSELLAVGTYTIRYTVADDAGRPDFNPADNVRNFTFEISADRMRSGGAITNYYRPGGSPQTWGYASKFYAPNDPNIVFSMSSFGATFASNTSVAGESITPYVFKVGPDFYDPGSTATITFNENPILQAIAVADTTLSSQHDQVKIELEFEAIFSEDPKVLVLEPGLEYIVMAVAPADLFLGSTDNYPNWIVDVDPETNEVVANSQVFINNLGYNGTEFFGLGGISPVYEINFTITTVSNAPKLERTSYKVFPNPATNYFQVDLNFTRDLTTTMYLADMNGRLLKTMTVQGSNLLHTVNTDGLAAGTYILYISNELGVATEKVMVIK